MLFAVAAMTLSTAASGDEATSAYRTIPFTLPEAGSRIEPVDLDGDGLVDLLTADNEKLSVYFQRRDGEQAFDFARPDAQLELKGNAVGWALDYQLGQTDGTRRLIALVDGQQVLAWSIEERKFSKPATVLDVDSAVLPSGVYPLNFVRDVNGDGLNDLIIPGSGHLHIYMQNNAGSPAGEADDASTGGAEGSYSEPLTINARMMNNSRLLPDSHLDSEVGQRVRIPALQVRDLNGDTRPDLISASEERIDVFLADGKGRFPNAPSWSVDLKALAEGVGEINLDRVDYSNLSGLLAHTFDVQLEDVDGDGIDDLLIREGGKLTLYGGSSDGMDMEQPRQVLRSSGNVMGTLLQDEDGDGLKDLWLMRVQNVSLANLFLWLAISGSIDIETFVYQNQGHRFASRPHRKLTLTVKFPSILRSVDLLTTAMEPADGNNIVRAVRAQLGDADSTEDLAVLGQNSLSIFMNKVRAAQNESFLGLSDYSPTKNNYVYDLGKMLENPARSNAGDPDELSNQPADLEIPLPEQLVEGADLRNMDVVAWELNADGRDDFFVLLQREESTVSGVILLSQ